MFVSVRKGLARLLAADGRAIGEGRAYLHLRQPELEPQPAQGTLSLDWWDDALSTRDARLELIDGPTLALTSGATVSAGAWRVGSFATPPTGPAQGDRPRTSDSRAMRLSASSPMPTTIAAMRPSGRRK